ncbi:MAG: hypothetical protein J6X61_01830 [Clostridia bacterium]|nr:hypothetical protein [Clostridia bacterium]
MTGIILRSALEVLIAAALVVGFCFEDRVARWERRTWHRIRRRFGRSNVVEINRKRSPQDGSRAI